MENVSRNRVEMLREEYERQRARMSEVERKLGEVSATVVSKRREVSVTVGSQGEITELKFPTSAYRRLSPTELSGLLMRTIGEARTKFVEQTVELMAPHLPAQLRIEDLLSGSVDGEAVFGGGVRFPPMVQERMDQDVVTEERSGA